MVMERNKYINGWPYIVPGIVVLSGIIIWPLITTIYYSFFDLHLYEFTEPRIFYGLKNYLDTFQEPFFLNSLKVTFVYTLITTVLCLFFGLFLALVLNNDNVHKKNIFVSIFIIPFVISPVIGGIIWRYMLFSPTEGIINMFLGVIGIQGPKWFVDPSTGMPMVIITAVWWLSPLAFLIIYSALSTVPEDIIDAAKIDGASPASIFKNIIFPFIKNHILFVSLILITASYRQFDQIWAITAGGPARKTEVLSILVYLVGIEGKDIGQSNAIAVFMFLTIGVICWIYIFIFRKSFK